MTKFNSTKFIEVGTILERRRLQIGLSVDSVAKSLNTKTEIINMLESGDIKNISRRIYYEGIIAKYCDFVGIKSSKIIEYITKDVQKIHDINSRNFTDLNRQNKIKQEVFSWRLIALIATICIGSVIINTVIKKTYNKTRINQHNIEENF